MDSLPVDLNHVTKVLAYNAFHRAFQAGPQSLPRHVELARPETPRVPSKSGKVLFRRRAQLNRNRSANVNDKHYYATSREGRFLSNGNQAPRLWAGLN